MGEHFAVGGEANPEQTLNLKSPSSERDCERYFKKAKAVQEASIKSALAERLVSRLLLDGQPLRNVEGASHTPEGHMRDIVPTRHRLVKSERSLWQKEDYAREAKRSYYLKKKKLPTDSAETPPHSWTTNQWEVFVFLGAPGTDDACLRPGSLPLGAGKRPQGRAAQRKSARVEAAAGGEQVDPASVLQQSQP